MAGSQKPALSDLENRVMKIVWEHNEVTAESVRIQIEASQPIKDSTVRTILRRLEVKDLRAGPDRQSHVCVFTDSGFQQRRC